MSWRPLSSRECASPFLRKTHVYSKTTKLQKWHGQQITNQSVVLSRRNGECPSFTCLVQSKSYFFSQGSKIGVACHSHTPSPRNVECTAICAWSCLFIFQTSSKFNNCIKQKNLEQKMIWDAENTFQSSTPGGYLGLLSYIKQFQLKIQTCFQLTHTCPPKKPKSQIMWTHTILRSNIKSVMRVPRKWMAGTTMLRTRLTLLYAGYELFFFHVAAKLTRLDD